MWTQSRNRFIVFVVHIFFSVLVIVQKKNINELNILLYGILGSGVQRQLDVLSCPLLLTTYFYALKMLVS